MKNIRIPKADREWLINELRFKLDHERSRQLFARADAMKQIAGNIAVQERLLEALTA